MKYKVGDTVVLLRVGKIDKIHPVNEPYPIEVQFEGGSGNPAFDVVSFTADGKTFEGDVKPSLFTEAQYELQFIAKLAKIIDSQSKWITQSPKGVWFAHRTKPVINTLNNAWFVNWANVLCTTHPPADFTQQIFELSDILTDDN